MTNWHTWLAHGLVGVASAALFGVYGLVGVVSFYSGKEYVESKELRHVTLDNCLDWLCPLVGAVLALTWRSW